MNAVQASLQRIFVECLETMLRPIVKLTLYCGLGHPEFSAAARRVFIEVASKEYGVRGRPANIAKIATKTGLPRKVIRRYRSGSSEPDWTPDEETSPLNTVIHYWRFDRRFCDSPGSARQLPLEGEDSFLTLVKSCAGDIPVSTIRQALLREGIATESDEGFISLQRDYSFPERLDEDFLRNAAFSIKHHADTLMHNATLLTLERSSSARHVEEGRFERLVWSRHLRPVAAEKFQQWVRTYGTQFILKAEDCVSHLEELNSTAAEDRVLGGVGVFFFRED